MEAIRRFFARQKKENRFFDFTLLFVVVFLIAFGLIMIYSASSYNAGLDYGDPAYYMKRQAIAAALGFVAMIFISFIPTKFYAKFTPVYYIVAVVLLLLLLTPLSHDANGATRWIRLVGGFNLQPAEVAKLCMILFMADIICKMGKNLGNWRQFLIALFAFPLPVVLMILGISKNLSSAIIVFGIVYLMIFVACPDFKKVLTVTAIGAGAVALVIVILYFFGEGILENFSEMPGVYRIRRIVAWFDLEKYASYEGFQTLQSLYAIGSGGAFGKGLGKSMQKLKYIPEAQNDMIFSILCEELGLFGAFCVIILFVILIWRCMSIAHQTKDLYSALVVVGVMGHIAIQAFLNIAVVTNTIPNTGISLPFISYGGSSIAFLMVEIGLVLGVGRSIKLGDGRS
ncbi:MAG: cell division protein FtsW [Lachnospiraceae bacterium]|nr:cell division protein FtsW [Lachnospiraceae bacterium]